MLFLKFKLSFSLIKYGLLLVLLLPLSLFDYYRHEIYMFPVYVGNIAAISLALIEGNLTGSIIGGVVGFVVLTLIIRLSDGAIGEGDRDLMLLCGLFLGLKLVWMVLLLSFILGAVISLLLVALRQVNLSDELAFAPFIMLSTFLTILYYEEIINCYINVIQYLI